MKKNPIAQSIKVLNPFAFKLERKEHRFYEIDTKPVYVNGEYRTFRYDNKWYVTCRGNIIVTETTGVPVDLIEHLVAGVEPEDYSKWHYRRILENWPYALQCAKRVGFTV